MSLQRSNSSGKRVFGAALSAAQAKCAGLCSAGLPAANKLNDFVGIAVGNVSICPTSSRQDIQISLDGNATRIHFQMCQQRSHREPFGHFSRLSIDLDLHTEPAGVFLRARKLKRISPSPASEVA
jgi:hypothetical protein